MVAPWRYEDDPSTGSRGRPFFFLFFSFCPVTRRPMVLLARVYIRYSTCAHMCECVWVSLRKIFLKVARFEKLDSSSDSLCNVSARTLLACEPQIAPSEIHFRLGRPAIASSLLSSILAGVRCSRNAIALLWEKRERASRDPFRKLERTKCD